MSHNVASDRLLRIGCEHAATIHLSDHLIGNDDGHSKLHVERCTTKASLLIERDLASPILLSTATYLVSQSKEHTQEARQMHLPGRQLTAPAKIRSIKPNDFI